MNEKLEIWIRTGYNLFAYKGIAGLKVEVLAKQVGISKSSFYHHFADLEIFVDSLLNHHIEQANVIALKKSTSKLVNPDVIDIILDHKTTYLFARQLRVNRQNDKFAHCIKISELVVGAAFIKVWKDDLPIGLPASLWEGIFSLVLEIFFLQITDDTLNHEWLVSYFSTMRTILIGLSKSADTLPLYGSN
jgi:AcrR family transcriptional regulator